VGDPVLDNSRPRSQLINQYFVTTAFTALPGSQRYGSAGRNILLGPGSVNWDISAFKGFAVTEHQAVQFRADIFNVFNQVNFGNPNTTLTSANFGKITSASSPRIFQFALKYVF
jgi:hypothetical protein